MRTNAFLALKSTSMATTATRNLQDIGNNHWLVSDAWFVVTGHWVVKLDFVIARTQHHIEIPVEITE